MKFKIAIALAACLISQTAHARDVILFIGDGMGVADITATRLYKNERRGGLFIDELPLIAHVRTGSHNKMVTDSAAAITAMATGSKADNGCLGLGPRCDLNHRLVTIAEEAKKMGLSVGLVTTTRITHATPAGFYAHVADRNEEQKIAGQLLDSEIDVTMGGGCKYFSKDEVTRKGFTLAYNLRDIKMAPIDQKVVGCFADSHIPFVLERKQSGYSGPSLPEMTKIAIERLSKNPKGFFLMVEGGRIDQAEHDNRAHDAFEETIEFDAAVRAGASMTDPEKALILVTADHETGGLAINGYAKAGSSVLANAGEDADGRLYPIITWATGPHSAYPRVLDPNDPASLEAAHTAVDVPLFAIGMKDHFKSGTIENTDIHRLISTALFER